MKLIRFGRLVIALPLLLGLLFLSCSDDSDEEDMIVEPEPEEELTIDGEYVGTWSSTAANGSVYEFIDASARLEAGSSSTQWSGPFFFSRLLTSTFDQEDDGSLSLVISGDDVSSFTYNSSVPNCNGTFSGSGTRNEEGTLRLEFTGEDCEGAHSGGLLILRKIQ